MADAHLPELLRLLGVERVIVIDDQFTPPASVYTLAFDQGTGPEIENLPPLPEGADYDDHVNEHWPDVPLEAKLKVRKQAQKIDGFIDPTGDPTGLKCLIGDRTFRGMTLHEWSREETRLLGIAKRALVLFDVNFGLETGDENDEAGLGPAGRALRDTNDHIVGLLTTKTAAGHEDEAADAWAPRAEVERADLVVVNKNLLVDPSSTDDIARAVEQIRSALQASRLSRLREKIHGSLEAGLRDAAEALGQRSPTALEDLVFMASRDGGEWEGDTWFRLYSTLGLDRARRSVALDKPTRRAIADVRNLLHSRPAAAHDQSAALAAEIEQAECYDAADYLNHAGLPIANGDIFQASAGSAFILVGQPCDLALRPDGRSMDPLTATVLPLKRRRLDSEARKPSAYRLPPGSPLGEGDWEVRFRPEHHVAFDVLDLVSFNTEGRATINPRQGTALSPLLPGLQKRLDAINKNVEALGKPLAEIHRLLKDKQLAADMARRLRKSVLQGGGPFKPTISGQPTPFAFDCKRIGRLAGTYADALLAAHSNARSRTAHAHELTRIVADDAAPSLLAPDELAPLPRFRNA
jgi:hypothetical protein